MNAIQLILLALFLLYADTVTGIVLREMYKLQMGFVVLMVVYKIAHSLFQGKAMVWKTPGNYRLAEALFEMNGTPTPHQKAKLFSNVACTIMDACRHIRLKLLAGGHNDLAERLPFRDWKEPEVVPCKLTLKRNVAYDVFAAAAGACAHADFAAAGIKKDFYIGNRGEVRHIVSNETDEEKWDRVLDELLESLESEDELVTGAPAGDLTSSKLTDEQRKLYRRAVVAHYIATLMESDLMYDYRLELPLDFISTADDYQLVHILADSSRIRDDIATQLVSGSAATPAQQALDACVRVLFATGSASGLVALQTQLMREMIKMGNCGTASIDTQFAPILLNAENEVLLAPADAPTAAIWQFMQQEWANSGKTPNMRQTIKNTTIAIFRGVFARESHTSLGLLVDLFASALRSGEQGN